MEIQGNDAKTPLRCKFGLHQWGQWNVRKRRIIEKVLVRTGEAHEVGEALIQERICHGCNKRQLQQTEVCL